MFKFKNIFLSVLLFSFIASINSFSETIDVKDIHEQTVKNVDRHFYQGQVLNGTGLGICFSQTGASHNKHDGFR